ncbi:MAG: DUF1501 domain-containing protein [Paracoccaceae bacterium]
MSRTTRRMFLARTAALGCAGAASLLFTPITLASAPTDARFVVIILRGGMDGLDVVRPAGDPLLATYRPTLFDPTDALELDDGFFMLNPHLAPLLPLWKKGELGFAHAVATPYRDKRSHFDGQDILEAGTGGNVANTVIGDGWLNRMLAGFPEVTSQTAFAVGHEDMIILNGDVPVSSWSPDARLDLSSSGRRLLEALYHDDPVFREAGETAFELAASLDAGNTSGLAGDREKAMDAMAGAMLKSRRAVRARSLARFTAGRLNAETRVAAFSIGGWDTHKGQKGGLKKALGELSAAILALEDTLGENWQKTAVLALTEFGRTARENGSGGTDHGTGGVMMMAGGAIRGGKVHGDWPGIGESDLYENRDLMATRDVRAFAGHAMRGLFGLGRTRIENVVFPGLDLGDDPGILL